MKKWLECMDCCNERSRLRRRLALLRLTLHHQQVLNARMDGSKLPRKSTPTLSKKEPSGENPAFHGRLPLRFFNQTRFVVQKSTRMSKVNARRLNATAFDMRADLR